MSGVPWGLHAIGRFTVRLVPPGAPVWRPDRRAFTPPTSFRLDSPVLELYHPDGSAPFGRFVVHLAPGQVARPELAADVLDGLAPAADGRAAEAVLLAALTRLSLGLPIRIGPDEVRP